MKSFKVIWPILLFTLPTLGVLIIAQKYLSYEGAIGDISAWGAFFTVFGVLYAILVGFLLVTVLNRFSSLSQVIEEELNVLEDIRDFTIYLDGQANVVDNIKRLSLVMFARLGERNGKK